MLKDIDRFQSHIEAALAFADDSHSFADIKKSVAKGELQMWPGFSSIVITEIIQVPRYRALNIFLAGGNLPELEAMLPEIEKFAKHVGADRITLNGRKGWLRSFLVHDGYTESSVVMQKKL